MALLGIPDAIFKDVSFVTISIIILYFFHLQTYLENFLTWHMHVDCPHGNSLDAIVLCLSHDLSCIIGLCTFKNSVTHSTFGTLFIIISSILSSVNSTSLTSLSFKHVCHADLFTVRTLAWSSSFILSHLFRKFLLTSYGNSASPSMNGSRQSPRIFVSKPSQILCVCSVCSQLVFS